MTRPIFIGTIRMATLFQAAKALRHRPIPNIENDILRRFAPAIIIGLLRPVSRHDICAKLDLAGGKYLSRQDAINSDSS
jgi:hypothetical protein